MGPTLTASPKPPLLTLNTTVMFCPRFTVAGKAVRAGSSRGVLRMTTLGELDQGLDTVKLPLMSVPLAKPENATLPVAVLV